ncbi:hypothetical protein CK203_101966 [Vitis vinifera]|uniref:Uncharacterized protein n=1 Tax=Vitis vinifera TaxID=29760 RepID=A0A438BYB0_VITVI|nr:hypothetical protein CK203_101966 [Vitis vinifera]
MPSSPGRANIFSLCFPDEDFDYGLLWTLEIDGDDFITDVATSSFISIEGASDPVDPPLFFYFMSRPKYPLSGNSNCDSNSEEMKVTPVFHSAESVDFGTSDQPKELKIGSSYLLTRGAD